MSKVKTKNQSEGLSRQHLGARLREGREYVGFSQEEVATFLGIARSALSNIESGQRKIDALELQQLARLYGRSTTYFTGEVEEDSELPEDIAHLARKAADLSEEDRVELSQFVDFLRARKPRDRE